MKNSSESQTHVVPWRPIWGVIMVVLLYLAAPSIASILLMIYPASHHWTATQTQDWLTDSVVGQFIYVAITEVLTIGGLLLFLKRYKFHIRGLGLKKPRFRDAGWGLVAYPVYFGLYVGVLTLATVVFPSLNVDQKQQLGFDNVHGAAALTMTFISLVLLPPIVEEILVRGFLFTSLRRWFKFGPAALVTSLAFAAAHLPEGGAAGPLYVAAIDTFILSMVLCFVRERTGSLWGGITLHMLKNAVAFASLFIFVAH